MVAALRDVTPYLVVLMLVSTLGPLQFGFHLVRCSLVVTACHSGTLLISLFS